MSPQVFVTVGTDRHPFDRLVGWIDRWATSRPEVEVLVQRGTSIVPEAVKSVELMRSDELLETMADASVVVAQGGPGGIMNARSVGLRPIVVPRLASFGEAVDDHQVRFTRWMADRDMVTLADGEAELGALIDRALANPAAFRVPRASSSIETTVEAFSALVDPLLPGRCRSA